MINHLVRLLCLVFLLSACKKTAPKEADPPGKATPTFPEQNALCTTGTIVSQTLNTVIFTWNSSSNTESYDIHIKNLLTGQSNKYTSDVNQFNVTLNRNTPYSWYIVSKSSKSSSTSQSDTWKFYNAGPGSLSHTPFPAESVSPMFGAIISGNNVDLKWNGSDVDNDIIGYDVYLDNTSSPAIIKSSISDPFANGISVVAGNTYYWKVVTKDAQGNTSESAMFQFTVN